MATKLGLYNEALEILGERELSDLTENREPRRLLDNAWGRNFVNEVLELGLWNFALRSAKVDFSPSEAPEWGFRRVFDKPSDFVRLAMISADEYFSYPLTEYTDHGVHWYSSIDTIYVSYVSDDATFGGSDLSRWTNSFRRFAAFELALHIAPKLTGLSEGKLEMVKGGRDDALSVARSNDAMNQPPAFPPMGSWASARRGRTGHGGRRDRGVRGQLIG